jgi:virulence factor Mce-like protein
MTRRGTASLVASPVLVGAVTVLVSIIAVFIAYNANAGLPFVPTYDVKAELPTGNKLVRGNEVRVGGFRVGVVDEITPKIVREGSKREAVAVIAMKLDKTVEPLATDTTIRVRPRSALGLKYVELTPGQGRGTYTAGDTLPLKQASEGLELEDVFSTFDEETRKNSREALAGFGDAFAGRGNSLNNAIGALNPLFTSLEPVMRNLSDPETGLDQFFRQIGRAAAQVAPVARVQADLFSNMATTFEAIGRDPAALRATIEKSPPTIDTAVRSFRVQRPFLADFADLSRRLRPAVNELPRSLPAINRAFRVGTPILPRTVTLNRRLRGAFAELEDLFDNPNTLLTIRDLRNTFAVTRPALEFIAPYQTVCNYFNYFFHPLGEHQSTVVEGGTVQAQGVKTVNTMQENSYGGIRASRPWDVPPGVDPIGAKDAEGNDLGRTYTTPYQPAIDAQGNADCQNGQNGFVRGASTLGDQKLAPNARYGEGFVPGTDIPSGGNAGVVINDFPILSGGTFKSRELGLNNLSDVDKLR